MATIEKSFDAGLHTEQLSGRTQEIFFSAEEDENFVYPYNAFEVDSSKKTEFDVQSMESTAINQKIRDLMKEGFGTHCCPKSPRKTLHRCGYSQPSATRFRRQPRLLWLRSGGRPEYPNIRASRLVIRGEYDGRNHCC